MVFQEGGKPENPERNPQSKDENQQQTQPSHLPTLVGDKDSHHCTISAPHARVEFVVGSRSCSEGFSPGPPVFLPPEKPFPNFNSTWIEDQ